MVSSIEEFFILKLFKIDENARKAHVIKPVIWCTPQIGRIKVNSGGAARGFTWSSC